MPTAGSIPIVQLTNQPPHDLGISVMSDSTTSFRIDTVDT